MSSLSTAPEIYAPIPDLPGFRAGSYGTIWSCKVSRGPVVVLGDKWHQLTPYVGNNGYLKISLSLGKRGLHRTEYLHTYVALAFHGPRPLDMECRHKDGDKLNNHAHNLCWGTKLENAADKAIHGTHLVGEKDGNAKLTECSVRQIRISLAAGRTHASIALEHGVSRRNIGLISSRATWAHVP